MELKKILKIGQDDWINGKYNMFSLKITLEDETDEENNPTILHEYTHYLQNVTTFHGFTKIDDYIRLFLAIFANLGSKSEDPTFPLKDYLPLQNILKEKNLENMFKSRFIGMHIDIYGNYTFSDYSADDYSLIIEKLVDPYHNKTKDIPFIVIDDKKIPLNEITIRENMAMVSTVKTLKRDKRDVYDMIISFPHKEYSSIFDYLYNYLGDKDIMKLTYQICEIVLNLLPIERHVVNILNYIKDNETYLKSLNDEQIINEITMLTNYRDVFNAQYQALIKIVKERIAMFDKIILTDKNEFVKILKDFYLYIIKGLELRKDHISLYHYSVTLIPNVRK